MLETLNFRYVQVYGLKEPTDNIFEVLIQMAKLYKKYKSHKGFDNTLKTIFDIDACGHMMIKNFFDGHLGKIFLDDAILNQEEELADIDVFNQLE